MRVHFFVRSLREDGAGSHQNAISFIRCLKERGHFVAVHAINAPSFNNPPEDIQIIAHAKEKLGLVDGNKFLTDLLFSLEKEVDIFFLYGVDFIWGAGRYRKNGGTAPVAVYLDTCLSSMDTSERLSTLYYIKRVLWEKLFGMRYAKWVDAYIASSPFIRSMYIGAGFPERRFSVVPNFFEFGATSSGHKKGNDTVIELLYAGRLTRDKGTDLLISAVKYIPADLKWNLRIVGEGPMKEECENMIRTYNLKKQIEIMPWASQSELHEIYKTADIFIHPSRCPEAFGRTLVEAMSYGVPVIASDIGSAPWTIGNAGILFSSGDVKELSEAINSLIRDNALRRHLGEEGNKQSQKFSKESVFSHLEDALNAGMAL
jgi:alpha-maltose-1-phosphate synthase